MPDANQEPRKLVVGGNPIRQRIPAEGEADTSDPDDPASVRESLLDAFALIQENEALNHPGLRRPQVGAVHAVLGHWTTGSTDPVTVVMPTGTGKTDTMLALVAAEPVERLLVLVPSQTLRTQLSDKFEAWGVLREVGVLADGALPLVVGRVQHGFKSSEAAQEFAAACNVAIATPSALAASEPEVRAKLLEGFTHLFIDEAHHVAARTWRQVRDEFAGRLVVQFTATPFREDGHHLGGRLLYSFPLREAQADNYFAPINYVSVIDFEDPDRAVAERAVEQLRRDLDAGLDHVLMARAKRIGRARDLVGLYQQIAPDLSPVLLASSLRASERKAALKALDERASRVITCVDMLGEGFDLPALKVAAVHDPHKSLGVTLQFVGRFTRTASAEIGDATVVVGRPDPDYDPSLRELYAEDADWNLLIRDLAEDAVGEQEEVSEFESGFGSLPDEVSLRNILPKMSTVVYRTNCESWDPLGALDIYPEDQLLTRDIAVNLAEGVAWFVTEERSPVRWGNIRTIEEISYDLYVLYWDGSRQLLYINSSNNESVHEGLAKAVCGPDAARITGETVYRVMGNVKRLVPTNVGVLDVRNAARRFSMHVGADVTEGFPRAEAQTKSQTNIFAYGFENGTRVSFGASLKGRVWSHRAAPSLKHWVDWCDSVGRKLTDDSISVDEVMNNFIRPEAIEERPRLVSLGIEWPWEVFQSTTEGLEVEYQGSRWPLIDADLTVRSFSDSGPIEFAITTPDWSADYEAILGDGATRYRAVGTEVMLVTSRRRLPLGDYMSESGLTFLFEQDAVVVPPAILLQPDRDVEAYSPDELVVLDWDGIDIRKESQGADRDPTTVQARTIAHILSLADWDVVIDDDGTGEIADVVAVRRDDQELVVYLAHCKYSAEDVPGSRVADLYEVCGQAQKSVRWRRNTHLFFQQLIRREKHRVIRKGRTGFEVGDAQKLYDLEDQARLLKPRFTIAVAQPGLSKGRVSSQQLDLLGSTDVYVYETSNSRFEVICSP